MASDTVAVVSLAIETVMERLGLSRAEVYRQVKDGKLKAKKENRTLVFAETDVAEFASTRDAEKTDLSDAVDRWLAVLREAQPEPESIETGELALSGEASVGDAQALILRYGNGGANAP